MGNVRDLADERAARAAGGWHVSFARCAACRHRWIAVHPGGAEFECPQCRRMSGRAVTESEFNAPTESSP